MAIREGGVGGIRDKERTGKDPERVSKAKVEDDRRMKTHVPRSNTRLTLPGSGLRTCRTRSLG